MAMMLGLRPGQTTNATGGRGAMPQLSTSQLDIAKLQAIKDRDTERNNLLAESAAKNSTSNDNRMSSATVSLTQNFYGPVDAAIVKSASNSGLGDALRAAGITV